MTEHDTLGPVSYFIVEFPGNQMTGEGLPMLVDLSDRGIIRILDLLFVTREADGSLTVAEVADFDGDGALDLAIFAGATSGLIGDEDLAEAAEAIAPNSSAAILLFENRWAAGLAGAVQRGGGDIVSAGYVPQDVLLEALETVDA